LSEQGILKRAVLIDQSKLGYEQWVAYVSFSSGQSTSRKRALSWVGKHPHVAWFAELGNEYHVGVAFNAKSAVDVERFLHDFGVAHGGGYRRKAVARALGFTTLSKHYLLSSATKQRREVIEVPESKERVEVDTKDLQILAALGGDPTGSRLALAKRLGLPRTTIEYRLKRLVEERVIVRELYHVSGRLLGAHLYRALISLKGFVADGRSRILAFALSEPSVVSLTHCLGAWDLEVSLEVSEPRQAIDLIDRLADQLENILSDVVLIPVFSQGGSSRFMAGE
jgi:DNA-binding Lrp family transcriptional regulator